MEEQSLRAILTWQYVCFDWTRQAGCTPSDHGTPDVWCVPQLPMRRMVIHYQLPPSVDTYIHRSGRTARGQGSEGTSVALVAPEEAARWVVGVWYRFIHKCIE